MDTTFDPGEPPTGQQESWQWSSVAWVEGGEGHGRWDQSLNRPLSFAV